MFIFSCANGSPHKFPVLEHHLVSDHCSDGFFQVGQGSSVLMLQVISCAIYAYTMVLKKRLDDGFNGFRVPFIPRAPRSARRRSLFTKVAGHGQACAFELLASLAGKLLQESENSSASSNASEGNHHPSSSIGVVEQERQDEVKPLATEDINQGGCAVSIYMAEVASQITHKKCLVQIENDAVQELTSFYNVSACWEKVEVDVESEICKWGNKFGHYSCRSVETHQDFRDSCGGNVNRFRQEQEAGGSDIEGSPLVNKCSLKHPLDLRINSTALIDSNINDKCPLCRGPSPNDSFSRRGNNIKLDFRDDDENFFRCNKVSTKSKPYRPQQQIAHQRIRRLLTSKYWEASPKLKDCELSGSDRGVKLRDRKRKTCCSFGRYQHSTHFKRKKFFEQGPVVTSDGGFSRESVSNSPEKGMDGDNHSSFTNWLASRGSHVKFSIESFMIPELYIEVPETTTIGSLKRTVMEAAMAILGGGVCVDVLLQGTKVRDDNRTLVQTGISCKENLDSLGFTLQPKSLEAPPDVCVGDPETSPGIRSSVTPISDSRVIDALCDSCLLTSMGNVVKTNKELSPSPSDSVADKVTPTSLALLPISARSTEPLAVVPVSQKIRHSELVQRRTRRPFSVSEVEALVQAVEELGTGRWRDVKLCAFENADHRTCVDLKDKWKTLVHTARISPQQRRGEPVPQQLLDRVLAAHAFWSQQHGKHQPATMKSTEALHS